MYKNISVLDNLISYRFLELYKLTRWFVKSNTDILKVALLYAGMHIDLRINTKAGLLRVNSLTQYRKTLDKFCNKQITIKYLIDGVNKEYFWLHVKNEVVVDIGANVGDSSIYFAQKGAKHVYAYEPYPYSYIKAKDNIKKYRLSKKISMYNVAVGAKEGVVHISEDYKNTGGTDLKDFGAGKKINVITLKKIIEMNKIKNGVLKIDCEGCEYGIILGAPEYILKIFKQIEIEYHYGYIDITKKLVSAGFKVRKTRPRRIYNIEAKNPKMIVGLMYAERK